MSTCFKFVTSFNIEKADGRVEWFEYTWSSLNKCELLDYEVMTIDHADRVVNISNIKSC